MALVAAATTTWNPSDKSVDITLSGGNLVATRGVAADNSRAARAVASHSTGKYYYEASSSSNASATTMVGMANSTQSLTGLLGGSLNGIGWIADGRVFINNSATTTIQTWTTGQTLCVAVDLDNSNIWFRTNGGNWNNSGAANPATNTGGISISGLNAGPYFPAMSAYTSGDNLTANFGGSAYAQTAPSGFGNW